MAKLWRLHQPMEAAKPAAGMLTNIRAEAEKADGPEKKAMELKDATDFFESLGGTQGRLLRVEVLVLFSTLVWILLELFGSCRRRYSHWFFRLLVWAVYTLFTVLPPYTVGLLQAGPFRDQTFVLWGTVLLLIQVSIHSLAVYNIHDTGERKRMLVQHLLQVFLVLWLIVNYNGSNNSYSATIWMFWIVSVVKVYRMSRFLGEAGNKGGLLEHSKLVADYMFVEHEVADADQGANIDPKKMAGYRYIFHGEEKLASLLPTAPEYRVELKDQVATGNMIVEHERADADESVNINPNLMAGYRYIFHGEKKVASLLPTAPGYRVELTEQVIAGKRLTTIDSVWRHIESEFNTPETIENRENMKDITLSFALFKLLKRRFCDYRLGEIDHQKTLNFVLYGLLSGSGNNDYVRAFGVIETELSFMYDFFFTKFYTKFDVLSLMVIAATIVWHAISGAFSRHYHRSNLEQRISETDVVRWITIVLLPILLFISVFDYAVLPYRWAVVRELHRATSSTERVKKWKMISFCKKKGSWERKLGQYRLLVNFDYHPWNVLSYLTLNLVDAKREGQKAGKKIELPEQVIVRILSRFKDNNGKLEHGQSALAKHRMSQFSWACALPSHIHTILVWHIATTMCAMMEPLDVDRDDHLVAKSLSDYCAYLVALVPDMLPGHAYDTQRVFDAVVMEARKQLGGYRTLNKRCQVMRDLKASGNTILELGGRLGRELENEVRDEVQRWKLLADFWAEFILFLAPSTNTDIHAEKLAAGGEFMTHLWALLTHAGILDRPSSNSETRVDAGGHDRTSATTQDSAVSVNPDHHSSSSSVKSFSFEN